MVFSNSTSAVVILLENEAESATRFVTLVLNDAESAVRFSAVRLPLTRIEPVNSC